MVNTQLPLLTDLSQLEAGLQTEGYVIKTYSKGVLVGFYANVKVRVNPILGTCTVYIFYNLLMTVICSVTYVLAEHNSFKCG